MLVWRMTKLYTDECRTQTIVYRESVREEGRDRETQKRKKQVETDRSRERQRHWQRQREGQRTSFLIDQFASAGFLHTLCQFIIWIFMRQEPGIEWASEKRRGTHDKHSLSHHKNPTSRAKPTQVLSQFPFFLSGSLSIFSVTFAQGCFFLFSTHTHTFLQSISIF